jgi:predicted nucleic acid-binding protein
MSVRVFVDTNVFAYVFDDGEPAKQVAARQRVDRERRDGELVASTQVLQELYVCLTRGAAPIASAEVAEQAVLEVGKLTVVQIDAAVVFEAIALCRRSRISFWDALIVRAAVAGRCDRLLTEDLNDTQVIDGVRVENPFAVPPGRSRRVRRRPR